MSERLKDMFFTSESLEHLADAVKSAYPPFDRARFLAKIQDAAWPDRALKEKMHHTAQCLWETLALPYPRALEVLIKVGPKIRGFEALTCPDFVEMFGQEHWDLSMEALGFFTRYGSAEFAVRPFLNSDLIASLAYLQRWAVDPLPEVRRLASEGARPRLPWGMALPALRVDPRPLFPVLEKLKDDPSETVRRSVANHLNDISKDHPGLTLDLCEAWVGQSAETDWVVRHACRGLLKRGNARAMRLFGFGDPASLAVARFEISTSRVKIGDVLEFSLALVVEADSAILTRIDYGVDFVKSRGNLSRKVFHLAEKEFAPGVHLLRKSHSFEDRSTRKHYPGTHYLIIQVNGVEKASSSFEVI